MSDTIPKGAFCLILWQKNGGIIDPKYVPETDDDSDVGQMVGGYCEHAIDCMTCEWMQRELNQHPSPAVAWLCPECAGEFAEWAKDAGVGRVLWGHYSEGDCQNPDCWMIAAAGHPKHTIMLQLALGRRPPRR